MYLEHANVTVKSIEDSVSLLGAAFPDFRRRGGGALFGDASLGQWLHFGNDETYVALQELKQPVGQVDNHYESVGLNHLGFVVDDVEALIQRCKAAGFEPSDDNSMGAHPYRHRVYFLDNCGVEWEFVEYLSDDKAQQNDYTL